MTEPTIEVVREDNIVDVFVDENVVEVTSDEKVVDVTLDQRVVEVSALGLEGKPGIGIQGEQGDPGPAGPAGPSGPATNAAYIHYQDVAQSRWVIHHNLGFFPSVNVVDSAGSNVEGDILYIDINTIEVDFSVQFGGRAFLS